MFPYKEKVLKQFREDLEGEPEWVEGYFAPCDCSIGECPIAVFGETSILKGKSERGRENTEVMGDPYFVVNGTVFPSDLRKLTEKKLSLIEKGNSYLIVVGFYCDDEKDCSGVGYKKLGKEEIEEIKRLFGLYKAYKELPLAKKKELWRIYGGRNPEEEVFCEVALCDDPIPECNWKVRISKFTEIYYILEEIAVAEGGQKRGQV